MANQLSSLLARWYPERDVCDWVLGSVYRTEGPCYRKAGAMMLFGGLGQQFGMLSGGCLESDIQVHARQVMQSGESKCLSYDGSDEDDIAFQLGIGCGGTVHIMLHPLHQDNGYRQLERVYEGLQARSPGIYLQPLPGTRPGPAAAYVSGESIQDYPEQAGIIERDGHAWLSSPITPDPHLLVVGGGIDARPLVSMAKQLGWCVSVWDPRPANGRREFFPDADTLLQGTAERLPEFARRQGVDAAVLMSHNIALDAAALGRLDGVPLRYLALLGPSNRKAKVLKAAGLAETELRQPLFGPAGLDIGGELPESIALSILAQCHACLHQRQQRAIGNELAA